MRTVTFQSVLFGIARMQGYDPTRDLTPARMATFTEYVNQRILEAWKFEFWPEWTVTEQRQYRPSYTGAAVTAGTEQYFAATSSYYQALQASTGQAPATLVGSSYVENSAYWALCSATYSGPVWTAGTVFAVGSKTQNPNDGLFYQCIVAHTAGATFDATKFGVLTPFDKYVAYEQPGLTPIDEVQLASRRNPRVQTNNCAPLNFVPSNNGIQFDWRAPSTVWLTFRQRPPVFTTTLYSSATAYASGVTIYDATTGNCWTSSATTVAGESPSGTPSKWTLVPMPAILATFVKRAAFSDCLKDQKQTDRAVEELEEAFAELQDAQDRALAAQGQYAMAGVVTYGSSPVPAFNSTVQITGGYR